MLKTTEKELIQLTLNKNELDTIFSLMVLGGRVILTMCTSDPAKKAILFMNTRNTLDIMKNNGPSLDPDEMANLFDRLALLVKSI